MVWHLEMSSDGKLIAVTTASGGGPYVVDLFLFRSRRHYARLLKTKHRPTRLAFSPNGKLFAVLFENGRLRMWDVWNKKEIQNYDRNLRVVSQGPLIFSPDGKFLIVGDKAKGLVWLNCRGGKIQATRPFDFTFRSACAFFADGRVAIIQEPSRRQLNALSEFRLIHRLNGIQGRRILSQYSVYSGCTFSAGARTLATIETPSWKPILLEVYTGEQIRRLDFLPKVSTLRFSPNAKKLALGCRGDFTIVVLDIIGDGSRIKKLPFTRKQFLKCWTVLLNGDASAADTAARRCILAGNNALRYFKKVLAPVPKTASKQIRTLIDNLGNNRYAVRERAHACLSKLGDTCEAALVAASNNEKTSPEAHRRITRLLEKIRNHATRFG